LICILQVNHYQSNKKQAMTQSLTNRQLPQIYLE